MKSKYSPLLEKGKKKKDKERMFKLHAKQTDQHSIRPAAVRHRDFYHQPVAQ